MRSDVDRRQSPPVGGNRGRIRGSAERHRTHRPGGVANAVRNGCRLTSIDASRSLPGEIAAGFLEALNNIASGGLSESQTLSGPDANRRRSESIAAGFAEVLKDIPPGGLSELQTLHEGRTRTEAD